MNTITSTDTKAAVDAMSSAELLAGLEGLAPPEEARRADIVMELGAILDLMTSAHKAQKENRAPDTAFVLGLGREYMERVIAAMRAAQAELLGRDGASRRGPSREEMKRDALDRGDAYARLELLIATDTSKMSFDELDAHRASIRQAVADKGLGA